MIRQCLSIDQMRHLQGLGVDTSKASIYWARKSHGSHIDDESKGKWYLSLYKDFIVSGFTSYDVVHAFTLQDIIEMLPKEIGENTGEYLISTKLFIGQTDYNEWVFEYVGLTCIKKLFTDKDIMEAAYQMLCWCIENGYIKKEDE